MRWEKTQIDKIRNKKGEITKNNKEMQGCIGNYIENLYSKKCKNLEAKDKFLDKYDQPNLNEEDYKSSK
jgi:hypothetical protein